MDLEAALERLEPDQRALLAMRYVAGFNATELSGQLAVGPDGTALMGTHYQPDGPASDWVAAVECGPDGWSTAITIDRSERGDSGFWSPARVSIGRDGTAWVYSVARPSSGELEPHLHRRIDGSWERVGDTGTVPGLVGPQEFNSVTTVSNDGRLWVAFDSPNVILSDRLAGDNESFVGSLDGPCAGVLSFDGETWRQHLAGACATHVSAAPNGTVWATVIEIDPDWLADPSGPEPDPDRPPAGIYVITPEALIDGGS